MKSKKFFSVITPMAITIKYNIKSVHRLLCCGLLLLGLIIFVSCSKDDVSTQKIGSLAVSAKTNINNSTSRISSNRMNSSDVVITDFRLNLIEFELEIDYEGSNDEDDDEDDIDNDNEEVDNDEDDNDQDWDDDGDYDYEDEIELEGPFELDLMSGEITFIDIDMPTGVFEELEFEFAPSTDITSDLFGKSILMQGTINGTPFIFWHNFEDEVEVDFEDNTMNIMVSNTPQGVVILFDLDSILYGTNSVDLSGALDGNNDGIIEISPNDMDGNNELAEAMRIAIKEHIDLLDD
ncbi:hypothetical protein SAMN03097699_0402 [Flavobacteriaceae bacterium MAR_2010_188]|nr:hypothetical protein SAMN03097699_0402 [Flavobacteriaceae bacterium MAR_2010_188]